MSLKTNQILSVIRLVYWLGAIIDGLFAFDMTIIALVGVSTPLFTEAFTHISFVSDGGLTYRYAIGIGAALMWGWTVLLIWADQKPIERRAVLLITLFPVVVGLFITNIAAIIHELVTLQEFLLKLLVQVILMLLLLASYLLAKEVET
ncbi:MAG: hypothetical protein ACXAC8_16045 [Candidatus Hodarchaeales archaeon]|jgi:hypothetical protein